MVIHTTVHVRGAFPRDSGVLTRICSRRPAWGRLPAILQPKDSSDQASETVLCGEHHANPSNLLESGRNYANDDLVAFIFYIRRAIRWLGAAWCSSGHRSAVQVRGAVLMRTLHCRYINGYLHALSVSGLGLPQSLRPWPFSTGMRDRVNSTSGMRGVSEMTVHAPDILHGGQYRWYSVTLLTQVGYLASVTRELEY